MLCSFTGGYQYFGVSFCLHRIVEVNYALNMEAAGLSAMFVTTYKSAWWYNLEDILIVLTFTAIKDFNPVVLRMLFDM
jgi:hypothetical protein